MKTSKVLLIVTIFFLGSWFLFAQDALKKGVYNLSGSISYSNSKDTTPGTTIKQFGFSIAPEFNYFVVDNLLVGGSITFQYSEYEFSSSGYYSNNKDITRMYGIGPSIRYYFSGSEIIPFIGISASCLTINSSDFEAKSFTATAGINYFLSNSAALEPYLSYSIGSNYSNNDTNTFSLGIRVSYFIIN